MTTVLEKQIVTRTLKIGLIMKQTILQTRSQDRLQNLSTIIKTKIRTGKPDSLPGIKASAILSRVKNTVLVST